jgi:hypothetical protein
MSLSDAKMPRLGDKLEAITEKAEKVRDREEKKDSAIMKVIKKVTAKKN